DGGLFGAGAPAGATGGRGGGSCSPRTRGSPTRPGAPPWRAPALPTAGRPDRAPRPPPPTPRVPPGRPPPGRAGGAAPVIARFALPDPAAALAPLFAALAGVEVIGHNLQFDLRVLASLGFAPGRVYDTLLASRVLYAGRRDDKNAPLRHGLGDCVR